MHEHIRTPMKRTSLASVVLSAAALLIAGAGPAQAAPYTYKLLGFAYDEFVAAPIQARDGLLYNAGHGQGMPLSSAIAQEADVEAFLFDQLGMNMN